jgi:lambda family phage tail tape measure protein
MADVIGRGVIEISADARKLRATIEESKRSLRELGDGQVKTSTAASRSIDNYIGRLHLQNALIGRSARDTDLFKLAFKGASDAQLRAADAALKFRDSQAQGAAATRGFSLAQVGLTVGFITTSAQLITLVDEYTKFTVQLRLASNSQQEFAQNLDKVRNIARTGQVSLEQVGILYARIAKNTTELGLSQQKVSDITESVALALRVSGSTAKESASAVLQLSQAFGSGVLRGEEFNAVNEAAPRLMQAIAEGIGVPVGALREMASQGKLTSEVLAVAIPGALKDLREEAKNVTTLSGALVVLRNSVVDFVGTQATAGSAVAAFRDIVVTLADNLNLVAAAAAGLITLKLTRWAADIALSFKTKTIAVLASADAMWQEQAAQRSLIAATAASAAADRAAFTAKIADTKATLDAVVAERASVAAKLAAAQAEMTRAQATLAATNAMGVQSAAMRANAAATLAHAQATAAQSAAMAQLVTLGQQQTRLRLELAAAEATLAGAMAASTTAAVASAAALQRTNTAARLLTGTIRFLGGPVSALITVLTLGATAWTLFGTSAADAANKAADSSAKTTDQILADLDKQIAKLEARRIAALSNPTAFNGADPATAEAAAKAGEVLGQIKILQGVLAEGKGDTKALQGQILGLADQYTKLTARTLKAKAAQDDIQAAGRVRTVDSWMKEYATDTEKLNEELDKLRKDLKGAPIPPELEKRIREKFTPKPKKQRIDKTQEREDKSQLALDLARIKQEGDLLVDAYGRTQNVLEALRSANLVADKEYYESRIGFVDLLTRAQEDALEKHIARLKQETFTGKEAAKEELDNKKKIEDAEASLAKLRADAVAQRVILGIQERAANEAIVRSLRDATIASEQYLSSIERRNAAEVAGLGRGEKFREQQQAEQEIADRLREQREKLQGELRRDEITKSTFDTYIKLAEETYTREIELYRQRTKAIEQDQKNWISGTREALTNYINDTKNVSKQAQEATSRTIDQMENGLTEFFTTGKLNAKSFSMFVQEEINRIFVKQRITAPLAELAGSGNFLEKIGSFFSSPLGTQAPAPVISRDVGGAVAGVAGSAAKGLDSAAFSTAVTASGIEFSTTIAAASAQFTGTLTAASTELTVGITSASTSFTAETIAAGVEFTASIVAAGAEFAASVTAASAGGGGGGGGGIGAIGSLASNVLGSFASGVDYVPKTGLYELHQGERVVTARANSSSGGMRPIMIQQNFAPGTDRRTVAQAAVDAGREVNRHTTRGTA